MRRKHTTFRNVIGAVAVLAVVAAAFVVGPRLIPAPLVAASLPEQLVYSRSADDVVSGGVWFTPASTGGRQVAVLWVHGWGVNFYSPTYVGIGRELAKRGLTSLSVNTRMHDIANVQQYIAGQRVRGGAYWGVPSEQVRDIAAWIDFCERQGFAKVVLVGHSAGWAAVRQYQAETRDDRVAGLVVASGQVWPGNSMDAGLVAEADRLVRDGVGDDLLRLPNRSFPSFVSAATYLDDSRIDPNLLDFFGIGVEEPGVASVRVPILAFFGTRDDVGAEAELDALEAAIERHVPGLRVDSLMIRNGDHMYSGEEAQVAQAISDWVAGAIESSDRPASP